MIEKLSPAVNTVVRSLEAADNPTLENNSYQMNTAVILQKLVGCRRFRAAIPGVRPPPPYLEGH